jgi:hypothetical protein
MYLRGSSFAQKWQVESPVNTSGFFYSTCSRAPLNALRERTLATQSYLGQHWSSFTLANQGRMPEEVKHDYQFCQYHNPPLAHNNGPCDCLTWTNRTKWSSSVPPIPVVTQHQDLTHSVGIQLLEPGAYENLALLCIGKWARAVLYYCHRSTLRLGRRGMMVMLG